MVRKKDGRNEGGREGEALAGLPFGIQTPIWKRFVLHSQAGKMITACLASALPPHKERVGGRGLGGCPMIIQ